MTRDEWLALRVEAVRASLPAAYRTLSVEHPRVRDWCAAVVAGEARSLVLAGPKGTGKTGNAWTAWPHLIGLGWVGRWRAVTEVDFQRSCVTDRALAAACRVADVLLLDDVGGHPVSDWSRAQLLDLLDARWQHHRPTVVTTNLTSSALADHLGDRATSRLADGAVHITLTGPDRRLS